MIGALLCLTLITATPQVHQPNNAPQRTQNAAPQDPSPYPPVTQITETTVEPSKEKQADYWWRVIAPDILPLWLQTIVIGAGVYFAWKTLKGIKDQVTEMRSAGEQTKQLIAETKTSAEAALLNARSLRNSERAWVDGELTRELPDSNPGWEDFTGSDYALKVTNHGRTPAFIIEWDIGMTVTGNHQKVKPEEITERFNRPLHFLLLPNETKFVDKFDMKDYFGEEWGNILVGANKGVVHVIIRYSDVVSGLGEKPSGTTEFVYAYRIHKIKFTRIDTFNKFT